MSEYLVGEDKITELIPQRNPIVMIDKLISCEGASTVSGLLVKEDNIFSQDGFLQEPGLVENIAQTAAARVGYVCKQENKDVPVGFIGAVKNLKIYNLPKVNSEINTEVVITNEIMGVTIIKGQVNDEEGNILAECEMKIFLQKEDEQE